MQTGKDTGTELVRMTGEGMEKKKDSERDKRRDKDWDTQKPQTFRFLALRLCLAPISAQIFHLPPS